MKYFNTIIYLVLAVFIVLSIKQCENNKQFKAKLDVLRASRDSLKGEYQKLEKVSDSLSKIKNKTIVEYKTIIKYIKEQQNETDSIVDSVGDYDERKLDSIISNHRHIKRN